MVRNPKDKVLGPYFFENGNVNGENYRKTLINYAFLPFDSLKGDYIFHQNGAPAHCSSRVRRSLDNEGRDKRFGRGGLAEWPVPSPDLTPSDFSCRDIEKKRYRLLQWTLLKILRAELDGSAGVSGR